MNSYEDLGDGSPEFDEREDDEILESQLAADRRLARAGITVVRFSSGHVMTQNSRGRCIDAPCCSCCS